MRSDFFLLKVLLSLLCSILARAVSCLLLLLVEYASFLAVLFSCDVLLSLLSTILLQFVVLYYYSLSWCLYNLSLQVLCLIIITTGIPVERNYGRNPQASRNVWQRQHYHLPPLASFFSVRGPFGFGVLIVLFTWYLSLLATALTFEGHRQHPCYLFAHLFTYPVITTTYFLFFTLHVTYCCLVFFFPQGHRQYPCYWNTLCGNTAVGCECKHDDANYAGLTSLV